MKSSSTSTTTPIMEKSTPKVYNHHHETSMEATMMATRTTKSSLFKRNKQPPKVVISPSNDDDDDEDEDHSSYTSGGSRSTSTHHKTKTKNPLLSQIFRGGGGLPGRRNKNNNNNDRRSFTTTNTVSPTTTAATTATTTTTTIRVGLEEEILRKNRKIVNQYLRKTLSKHNNHNNLLQIHCHNDSATKEILNLQTGMAYLTYKKFVIIVEVPMDNPHTMFVYTMVCRVTDRDDISAIMKLCMRWNYMELQTRGSTLGYDEQNEINLCHSCFLPSTLSQFQMILENFVTTASDVHTQLEQIKNYKSTAPKTSTLRLQQPGGLKR